MCTSATAKAVQLLPPLRSRLPEYLKRRFYSSGGRSWGGIEREGVPIRRLFPLWAVPCPLLFPCLLAGAMDGCSKLLASWEPTTPESFNSLSVSRGGRGA